MEGSRDCVLYLWGFLYCSPFEPDYWSKLAGERRVLAQDMPDDKSKQMMLRIAEDYEQAPAKLIHHAVPNFSTRLPIGNNAMMLAVARPTITPRSKKMG